MRVEFVAARPESGAGAPWLPRCPLGPVGNGWISPGPGLGWVRSAAWPWARLAGELVAGSVFSPIPRLSLCTLLEWFMVFVCAHGGLQCVHMDVGKAYSVPFGGPFFLFHIPEILTHKDPLLSQL